jgi:hypothetical protein
VSGICVLFPFDQAKFYLPPWNIPEAMMAMADFAVIAAVVLAT